MMTTRYTAMICRVYMKHHINKHTVNRKVKCAQAVDPSCRACIQVTYMYECYNCLYCHQNEKSPQMGDTGWVSTY